MTAIRPGHRNFGADLLSELNEMRAEATKPKKASANIIDGPKPERSFLDHIQDGVENVNSVAKKADVMASDLASGNSKNIHETMLAATHAELSFNLMVAIRNKVLESYQEVMRMQI